MNRSNPKMAAHHEKMAIAPHSQSQSKGRGHTIQMSDEGFIVTRNSRQTKSFQQN